MKTKAYLCVAIALLAAACGTEPTTTTSNSTAVNTPFPGTFAYDKEFLNSQDRDLIVLTSGDQAAQVLVSAKYQGKVFTSTAAGDSGRSFGWVNYKAFNGPLDEQMNAYGGENRLWLGPEGAQFSLFFKPETKMEFSNWHTPPAFDSESWNVASRSEQMVALNKEMELTNYAGTPMKIKINRTVRLLNKDGINEIFDINLLHLNAVAFSTENSLTNAGTSAWDEKSGAPCIWILDMFTPSPATTIVIPYTKESTGRVATTDYFGQIPADRVSYQEGVLYFKADGKSRGKLGLSPQRARTIAGSYDAVNQVLTLTSFDINREGVYLNQEWKVVPDPLKGDAVNAYNDGPLEEGSQMGPFYELESVSPAAFLKPGETLTHHHSVIHLTGDRQELNQVARRTLGVSLEKIQAAFSSK